MKPIVNKHIVLAFMIYLLWVIGFAFYSYQHEKQVLYSAIDQQLESAALTAPLLLPKGLHHQAMSAGELTLEQDHENMLRLSEYTDGSDIAYIYTMVLRDQQVYFTTSSETVQERESGEETPSWFDLYADVDPRVIDVFNKGEKAFLEYTDRWGTFRSIFIPQYADDGTYYMTAADLTINHIQSLLSQNIYRTITISLLFLLLVSPLFFVYTHRLNHLRLELEGKLQQQTFELAVNEERLKCALATANQGWFDINLVTNEVLVSDEYPKLLGFDPAEFDSNEWLQNIHPDDLDNVQRVFNQCLETGGPTEMEYRRKGKNGNWLWIHSIGEIIEWDKEKTPTRMIGIHMNVNDRVRNEQVLRALAEIGSMEGSDVFKEIVSQLALTYNMSHAFIACIDPNNKEIAKTVAAWGEGDFMDNMSYSLEGTPCQHVTERNEMCFYPDNLQELFPDDQLLVDMDVRSYVGVPLISSYNEVLGLIVVLNDKPMTIQLEQMRVLKSLAARASIELERREQQKKLELMAHYDVLTQLPNRALFADRFGQAVAHSKRSQTLLAICFLDLDDFKLVNDSFGHKVGDELLIEVARRIKVNIRDEDTVSRQGGDEFALLLGDLESYPLCEQMLERLLIALAQPYLINDYPHMITASMGLTLFPYDDADLDTLLRHADQSMYQAKLDGRNQYHLFNPEQDHLTMQQQDDIQEIEHALAANEFQLYYQPKVNMKTGEVYGAEALIRWNHPEKGFIAPLDFLPKVEGTDLEIEIGDWVVAEALRQLGLWQMKGIELQVSVNIGCNHLQAPSFFGMLNDLLELYPSVDSHNLQLEILESSALGELHIISSIIKTCRDALGVGVALDDFGTGYSSLAHIRNLSADTIKIDQSFVRDMLDDPNDYAIIDSVIGLSDSFNRAVIAEGVENTEQGLMLLVMGCKSAQGYGIARPMPADKFLDWLKAYTPNQAWIDCGNTVRSVKESKLKLHGLAVDWWQTSFETNINTVPGKVNFWPIMVSDKCHCSYWSRRAHHESLFDKQSLEKHDHAHEAMHVIANDLFHKHQHGEAAAAVKGLAKLQAAFDVMRNVLKT